MRSAATKRAALLRRCRFSAVHRSSVRSALDGANPLQIDFDNSSRTDGICHDTKVNKTVPTIKNYINVTDKDSLQKALANIGPVSVSIDASMKTFTFYSNGVFYDPKCRNDTDGLDHAVLAVGYGTLAGEPYWLIKNSWSTYWGNDGYVLISQKDNNCGVATQGTYVEL